VGNRHLVTTKRTTVIALVIVGLAVSAVVFYVPAEGTAPERFCTTSLHLGSVNGGLVALEDQGSPGRDGCELRHGEHPAGYNVLGLDCKVRDVAEIVVATTTPNRPDGTCGR
jgi:hypothetical protein